MPARDPKPNHDAILDAMVYLYSESRRVTRAVAEQYGLTGSQLLVLKMLAPREQISLSELSAKIRAKNSTVTGIIDRMERDGLVQRSRSETDRRVVHLGLTAKGRKLSDLATTDPMHLFRALLEDMPSRDAAELERIMTTLAGKVRAFLGEDTDGGDGRDAAPAPLTRFLQEGRGKAT